jgi:hypothetical protein
MERLRQQECECEIDGELRNGSRDRARGVRAMACSVESKQGALFDADNASKTWNLGEEGVCGHRWPRALDDFAAIAGVVGIVDCGQSRGRATSSSHPRRRNSDFQYWKGSSHFSMTEMNA